MLKEFEVKNWNGEKIIIYGAGHDGKIIADILVRHDINNFIFCDTYKSGEYLYGKKIISLNDIRAIEKFNIIIGSSKYSATIYDALKKAEVIDEVIYTAKEMWISSTQKLRSHSLKDVYAHYKYEDIFTRFNAYINDGWYLKHLDIVITEICTLNCEACGSLMPLYRAPHNCDEDSIFEAFDNLLKSNCYIGSVNLIGGEPFVNQSLMQKILYKYKDEKHIGVFQVISNGTIVPNEKTLEAMKCTGRLYVIFSNYGRLSKKQDEAVNVLNEYGIDTAIEQEEDISAASNTLWIDYGKVQHYDFPEEKHQKMFEECEDGKSCTTLMNGKLFICPRIAHGVNLGLIPEDIPRCSLDLLDSSLQGKDWNEVRKSCIEFLKDKKYPPACEYCNHDAGILVERAKQAARK